MGGADLRPEPGVPFGLDVEGVSLSPEDRIAIVPRETGCADGEPSPTVPQNSTTTSGLDLLTFGGFRVERPEEDAGAARYSVCWCCGPCGCPVLVPLGHFEMSEVLGPAGVLPPPATHFSLTSFGVGCRHRASSGP